MLIYPLEWPIGRDRSRTRGRAKFGRGGAGALLGEAREELLEELRRFDATDVKVSTNILVSAGGNTWRDQREPPDAGVAVYFRIKGQPRAMACDKWTRVADNLHALALTIGAIRGTLRWGGGSVDQAFGGFKALPAMGAPKMWHEVLGLPHTAKRAEIERRRLELLAQVHPDKPGGDPELAADVNAAYREALQVLKDEAHA